ncbi:MAG: T9SS type A sorting domain-containing protein, partial [Bacteroidales bacterium]|nr:T9SS type A sorting domain-containing protein [Bacteroidales bacterium]
VEISAVSDMDSEITLIDLTDHTETSLKNGNTYVANVNEGSNAGRFVLKVGSDAGLNQATGEETSLDIWTDGNTLTVVGDNLTEVTIYNVLGQEVYTKKLSGNYFSTTLTLESGYYVVKAKSSTKNKTYSLIH